MKISKILATVSAVFLMTVSVASAELLFEENFESESWTDNWIVTTSVVDENLPLSGNKSLYWNTKGSIKQNTGETAGNYVFEMWFYDTAAEGNTNPGGHLIFGAKYEEGGAAVLGFKSNSSSGYYVYGNKLDGNEAKNTNVARTNGWHQLVVDMTAAPKAVYYIDGVKVKEASISKAGTISYVTIFNSWNDGGGYHVDDVRVWESFDEVPAYENAVVTVANEDEVSITEPEITVEFKDEMNIESFDGKVTLTEKDGEAVEVELTEVCENSFKVVPKAELKYETEYVLTLSSDVRTKRFDSRLKSDVTVEFTTELNPFQIFDYGFKNADGEVVTDYTTGDLTFTASFTNKQEIDVPVTLFCVLYEVKDGKLLRKDGAFKTAVLNNDYDTVTLDCASVTIPEEGEYVLKGFLWSELVEKRVLRDSVVIRNN